MDYQKLELDRRGDILVLRLNDPARLNAAGAALMADLSDAIGKIASGALPARCVVITGKGRGFCSGANLRDRREGDDRLLTIYNPFIRQLRDLPIPLVMAVNGPAAGIGASFAMMGDLIVAAESAYFLQAFRRIGLVPDGGSTWMLPRLIGKARAMELMLLGEKLPAATALEWGLINRCVPDEDVMPTALALAQNLAQGPAALGMIRKLVWAGLEVGHEDQLEAERAMQGRASRTADAAEGVMAFLERRPAAFTGR